MDNIFKFLSSNQSNIYKVFLFVVSTLLIIYLLPKGGQFKYNFQKGKPWQYENLYAPFSFTIKKDEDAIELEKEEIRNEAIPYFDYNLQVPAQVKIRFNEMLRTSLVDTALSIPKEQLLILGENLLDQLYDPGYLNELHSYTDDKLVYLDETYTLHFPKGKIE